MAKIERRMGRRIPLSRLFSAATIEALAEALREEPCSAGRSPLVTLQPGGARPPVFWVHAIGGSALSYLPLSRALGKDQPSHAFQARGVDGDEDPAEDIQAMARDYIEELHAPAAQGSFWLAGWSFGGVVACEMARQIEARGGSPAGVLLLDTWLPEPGAARPDEAALFDLLTRELDLPLTPERAEELRRLPPAERLARLGAAAEAAGILPQGLGPTWIGRAGRVYEAHLRAFISYRPRPLDAPIVLVRPEQLPGPLSARFEEDPTGGLAALARRVAVRRAPGDHFSMLRPPHVDRLAEIVGEALRGAAQADAEGQRDEGRRR
jgi:thioesterase domain-containing protein